MIIESINAKFDIYLRKRKITRNELQIRLIPVAHAVAATRRIGASTARVAPSPVAPGAGVAAGVAGNVAMSPQWPFERQITQRRQTQRNVHRFVSGVLANGTFDL